MIGDENDPEWQRLQSAMKDAVQGVLAGSSFGPPDGGIVTDCVVIVGWADVSGGYGQSHLRCGNPWATEGLVVHALREMEDQARAWDPDDDA